MSILIALVFSIFLNLVQHGQSGQPRALIPVVMVPHILIPIIGESLIWNTDLRIQDHNIFVDAAKKERREYNRKHNLYSI